MDSINIKLNLRKVTKSIAKAVEELADPANYLRPAIFDVLDAFKQRIHVDGDRPGGSAIGTYTNPYLRYRINKFKRDSSTKMIFSLTRQMENDYTIAPTKNGYSIGFTNSFNFDKSQWLEEKKGEVFSLSQAEVDILYENIDFFIDRILNE